MTLCVVWEEGGITKFATDSRMHLDRGDSDCAVKLFRLPYLIKSKNSGNILAEGDLGLAAAGFGLSAVTFKDALSELLTTLETDDDPDRYSMFSLANLMFMIFEKIMSSMAAATSHHFSLEIVFSGYCGKNQCHRTFSLIYAGRKATLNEVIISKSFAKVFGDGATPAINLIGSSNNGQLILNAVQKVIDDPVWASVGGVIQLGQLTGTKLELASATKNGGATCRQRGSIDLDTDFAQEGFSSSFPLYRF